jgi:hypothetical protein
MIDVKLSCAEKRTTALRIVLPCLLFLLAFFLRTCGLSHDLHHGNVYHPDTPKQIRAVERFLDDRFSRQYYQVWNNRDLDGYPYFNSHLVEYVYRGYAVLKNTLQWHIGIPASQFTPDTLSIYWLTRVLNSLFSALAVVLIYCMGRRHFGPAAGLFAGLLLAFSPVDITTSNYAMSDSTASFFSLLTVYFALRIVDSPQIAFYVFGALAAAFAFSAKYHAGMALIPLGLAHLFAFPNLRSWVSVKFLTRSAVILAFFVFGVFLSTPSLFVYPSGAYKSVLGFMEWTSNFGMTREMRELSFFSRFILAMRINLPLLADYIGWIPLGACIVGMGAFRKHKAFWVLLVLPLFFILVGLTMKPLSHPDYFTVAIPLLFLGCAATLNHGWNAPFGRLPSRLLTIGLLCVSLLYLGNYAWHEIFFFRQSDTRRVAETWALDTLPRQFQLAAGSYTFDASPWNRTADKAPGAAYALSSRTPRDVPSTTVMHRVSFEQEKLSRMRNWDIRFLMAPNNFMQPVFSVPVLLRFPASRPDSMIQAHAPLLIHSPKVWEVSHRDQIRAAIVSESPLQHSAVVLHNDTYPADVSIRFGGRTQRVVLAPHERRVLHWEAPRSIPLSRNTNHFYRIVITSRFNLKPIRVIFAATPLEIARELHLAGEHDQAFARFNQLSNHEMNPSELSAMTISGLVSGRLKVEDVAPMLSLGDVDDVGHALDQMLKSIDDQWFFRKFGVHPTVFDWLSDNDPRVDPVGVVLDQIRILRALVSDDPTAHALQSSSWPLLLLRGRVLENNGYYSKAFAFYKAALTLESSSHRIYEALEGLIPFLPNSARELHQLVEPYRVARGKPSFSKNIRFANGIEIKDVTINTVHPVIGQHLEFSLDWVIPKLSPSLYLLEYNIQLM